MTDIPQMDGLDDSLKRVAARLGHKGFDATRTVRRLRFQRWWRIVSFVFALVVVAGAFWAGAWGPALLGCWIVIPNRWRALRERQVELDALLVDGDFLEAERKRVERKLSWVRILTLLELLFALNFGGLALYKPHLALGYWTLAGMLAISASVRLLWVTPALRRELKDLGGEEDDGWVMALFTFGFLMLAPFLIVGGVIYRGVRSLLGIPVPEEPEDAESAKSAGSDDDSQPPQAGDKL